MNAQRSLLALARRELAAHANAKDAEILSWFFKTGPGEYGAGDRFRGIRVPVLRQIARQLSDLTQPDVIRLLHSPYHEDRLLALLVWVAQFERGDESCRSRLHDAYLSHTRSINNWDLVDLSAPNIAGAWALSHGTRQLLELSHSHSLWERRLAIVATHAFIRANRFTPTLVIARRLLHDPEDLLHKATGWMLREVGKRDADVLRGFLARHVKTMPRTMLRYAIERFPEPERKRWMA
jgi:3-methyladenine DNA glycosylase AlkD